ncbi:MAG TPA: hypothetical protein DHV55_04025 [Clostridiaceae bacterium]|nr:hypothetical protein [Clostridiaceae bacterium]
MREVYYHMLENKGKISLRQTLLLYLTLIFSPSIRFVSTYTAHIAKQASYLMPIIALFSLYIMFLLLDKTIKKYNDKPMTTIITLIIGKTAGKILLTVYALWILIMTALFTRYYAERLVTSIFSDTNISIFIAIMLIIVLITLKSGLTILARMNEIINPIIGIVFFLLVIFLLPQVKLKNLMPISYIDILPVLKSSPGTISLWGYIFFIFLISDEISHKENLMKQSLYASLYLAFYTIVLLIVVIGSLGSSVTEKSPLPFMSAVKLISVFDILEKIESFAVIVWVLSDFVLIATLSYITLRLIGTIFNLKDEKPLLNIFILVLYLLALLITVRKFDLERFSYTVANIGDIALTLIIPPIILLIGLMKKKKKAA